MVLKKEISIKRLKNNPLLQPNPNSSWMNKNVFNCGVIIDDDGLYKMLFRAAWTEDQSMSDCGLALSVEGTQWYVLNKPVLKCGFNDHCVRGIEDPRIVKWIDGWKYIFATACSPAGGRVGVWRTKNFLEFEWVGIPFNQEDKDASIFPEPIDNWVYLMHRKSPHIWISRTRDLTLRSDWRDSQILIKKDVFYRSPNTGNLPAKIGIAGPPVKTPKGWLVIVHVVHSQGENMFNRVYSLGFMVLNLNDPVKVEYIHPSPILWPTEKYEIMGAVPVVCFSNAVVDPGGDSLYIYWGGADTVICGGKLPKEDLSMCY
jgi:predicted GH43/DUF377 family glycosyl hydrolase